MNARVCFLFFDGSLLGRLWDRILFPPLFCSLHSSPLLPHSCPAEATPEPSHEGSRPQLTCRQE